MVVKYSIHIYQVVYRYKKGRHTSILKLFSICKYFLFFFYFFKKNASNPTLTIVMVLSQLELLIKYLQDALK